jgi:putative ABC transport system permease protein
VLTSVLTSVLAEALAVGLIGSVVGLGFGIVVAFGLRAVLDIIDVSIPGAGLVVALRTVLVAVVLGVVVTVVSAVAPALRATRVPPVEAMRAVAAPPPARPGRIRLVLGALILVTGIATLSVGLFADGGLPAIAAGAVLVLFGVAGL